MKEGYDMEINAVTKYDIKSMKDFISFSPRRGKNYKARKKAYLIFGPICMILLASEMIFAVILFGLGELFWITLITLFIVAFIWAYFGFMLPSIYLKNMKKIVDIENKYIFYDDEFQMSSSNLEFSSTQTMKYTMLHKVYETSDYFYLFTNISQAYIVKKDGITSNSLELIRNAISSSLPPKKYILCK